MEWWGYSKKYGWVLLDRDLPCNKPGSYTRLLFVRCANGDVFFEDRKEWAPPNYIFEKRYLESVDSKLRLSLEAEVQTYKNCISDLKARAQTAWNNIKPSIRYTSSDSNINLEWLAGIFHTLTSEQRIEKAKIAHLAFLERIGKPYFGYADSSVKKFNRVTHCYNCQRHLDNSIDIECKACGWIICPCGACGCGWTGRYF